MEDKHLNTVQKNKFNLKIFLLIIALLAIVGVATGFIYNNYLQENSSNTTNNIQNIYNSINTENDINTNTNTDANTNQTSDTQTQENTNTNTNTTSTVSSDIFGAYYDKAETLMQSMTIEEKVGQMFLARYPESGVESEITNDNPGGYVLFGRDFKNKTKSSMLTELNNDQEYSKIDMFLGVDEEGGTVVRVSAYTAFRSSKFKSPQQLWQSGYLQAILDDSVEKSTLLKSIGLNMNLTPVVDVPTSSSSFIYARSYGRGAEKTAEYVSALIKTMNTSNIISTMKHFPGYGDNVDTHTGIAIDERPYSTFESSDFLPFISGIAAGAPTILVNHNVVKCMDQEYPASLSENVHKILRNTLNYSGLIITDDLAMDAVKTYVENGKAAVQAVKAGNDMIISSDFTNQKNEVLTAVKSGEISEDTINLAVKRILACKYAYGII